MLELDGIERELGGEAELAVIWLHGLGADASDFLPVVDLLSLSCAARFVFPNAPYRAVTINGGMRMRAWYDIMGFAPESPVDEAAIGESAALVRDLIERELSRGLSADRIALVGFSQGGAIALHAGLGAELAVAGIAGLSTYLPAPQRLALPSRVGAQVPVWLAHGTEDPVIPLALARLSAERLAAGGVAIEWSTYPMGHEVTSAELADLNAWLDRLATR